MASYPHVELTWPTQPTADSVARTTLSHRLTEFGEGPAIWIWTKRRITMMLRMYRKYVPIIWALHPDFRLLPPSDEPFLRHWPLRFGTKHTDHDAQTWSTTLTTCGVPDGKRTLIPTVWLNLATIWTYYVISESHPSNLGRWTSPPAVSRTLAYLWFISTRFVYHAIYSLSTLW